MTCPRSFEGVRGEPLTRALVARSSDGPLLRHHHGDGACRPAAGEGRGDPRGKRRSGRAGLRASPPFAVERILLWVVAPLAEPPLCVWVGPGRGEPACGGCSGAAFLAGRGGSGAQDAVGLHARGAVGTVEGAAAPGPPQAPFWGWKGHWRGGPASRESSHSRAYRAGSASLYARRLGTRR